MSEIRKVRSEELKAVSAELKCGDKILLSGIVYTARDAAHKRFNALLDEGKELPIPLKDAVIYYADLLLHLRKAYRFMRTDHFRKNGQVCTEIA